MLELGAAETASAPPPSLAFWRDFGVRSVTALCPQQSGSPAPPPQEELDRLAREAPPMTGAEYLTGEVLDRAWRDVDAAFGLELSEAKCGVQEFLQRRGAGWPRIRLLKLARLRNVRAGEGALLVSEQLSFH